MAINRRTVGLPGIAKAAICLVMLASTADAGILRVRSGATGAGDGSSWADAFTRIEDALAAAAPGDELWVAAGIYAPPSAVSSFVLRPSVSVYGGFAGTESARSQRDAAANLTVLSGDINGDDTVDTSPFAPPWPNNVILNTANAGHVVIASGVDASTVIDGFRIEKGAYGPPGTPAGDPLLYGSGIYCIDGSPTIADCDFRGNFASFGHGGAIYLHDSAASITGCTFDHNLAYQGSGGAIFIAGASAATVSDCTFTSNLAVATNGQTGQGGAIQLYSSQLVTITRCVFAGNISRPFGGGSFETPRGGAVSSFSLGAQTVIRECTFRNNQSSLGGGLFVWNPTTVLNCAFDHNTAVFEGAGIAAQWTTISVLNTTIASNTGGESSGIAIFESPPNFPALATVHNSIVWGNIALGQDVSPRNAGIRGPYDAEHSCIQDLFTVDPGEDPIDPANFPGCIAINPMLANAAAGDLHLLVGSPGIDSGANALVPAGTPVDLAGAARIVRGLPGPGAAVVDMGALELGADAPCVGDFDGNGVAEVVDIFAYLRAWFSGSSSADVDGTSGLGVPDIFWFLSEWFAGC